MAPITDETVQALRETIHKLETRVQQLESKLGGDGADSERDGNVGKSIRMVIMGPPGAGQRPPIFWPHSLGLSSLQERALRPLRSNIDIACVIL